MFKHGLLLALFVFCGTGQDTGKKEATEKEWKQLQGKWLVQYFERDGEKEKPPRKWWALIKDSKLMMNDENGSEEIRITINPTYSPKTIDVHEISTGKRCEGIYDLKNDRLRICISYAEHVKERPTEIKAAKGDGYEIWVFQRMKD